MTYTEKVRETAAALIAANPTKYSIHPDVAAREATDDARMVVKPEFAVGDGVHWGAGTDTESGTVVAVTNAVVHVVEDEATLLNPDDLTVTPGGFFAHVEGKQEYAFTPGTKKPIKFTFRKRTNKFKMAGTSINGSMRTWGNLYHGRAKHYDYNF